MVKKVATLESIEELGLSAKTIKYLMDRYSSLDEIIWSARHRAFYDVEYPNKFDKGSKCMTELINCLDCAGFIRHDINTGSFCVNALYRLAYPDMLDASDLPFALFEFYITTGTNTANRDSSDSDYKVANKNYEDFVVPSPDLLGMVTVALRSILPENEYTVLTYQLGFDDGKLHDYVESAQRYRVSTTCIRQLRTKAIRKIQKNRHLLPAILPSSDERKMEIDSIIDELEQIHQDPIFQREAELTTKLNLIANLPFSCADRAKEYLEIANPVSIDRLELSARVYNSLRRVNITTVADIIKLPKKDWPKIRNLGRMGMSEVEEKVRSIGFTNFSIK